MFIDWDDEWAIGLEAVDAEHRQLVDIVNRIHREAVSGRKENDLLELIVVLTEHARSHFQTEEELMKEHGFGEYEVHKQEHDDLITQIEGLLQEMKSAISHGLRIAEFLKTWLVDHIKNQDKDMGLFLRGKGVQ